MSEDSIFLLLIRIIFEIFFLGCKIQEKCRHFLTYDLFEVCLAFREVHAKRKLLIPVERKALLMPNTYHDWFLPSFASWLAVVSEQVYALQCSKIRKNSTKKTREITFEKKSQTTLTHICNCTFSPF